MKKNFNKFWFASQLSSSGYTVRGLAKHLKCDPSTISLRLRGLRGMTLEAARDLSAVFNVPLSEVLRHSGADEVAVAAGALSDIVGLAMSGALSDSPDFMRAALLEIHGVALGAEL